MARRLSDRRFSDAEITKIAGGVVVAFLVIGGSLFAGSLVFGDGDVTDGDASSVTVTPMPSSTPASPSATPASGLTEQGMTDFLEDYLTRVAEDPAKGWPLLTPAFQRESGGFTKYAAFWNPVSKAVPSDVFANPEAGTITYAVDYTFSSGRRDQDTTRIKLVVDNGEYLISGEG